MCHSLSQDMSCHSSWLSVRRMLPAEYKNGGESLTINYSFVDTPFGEMLVASTKWGLCYMAFVDSHSFALEELKSRLPRAVYQCCEDDVQRRAVAILKGVPTEKIELHIKATDFQWQVWDVLLQIPLGESLTYGEIARRIGRPTACRAVGTAVGDNPIAFLIPCHRVIRSTGTLGGYRWGGSRKSALLRWERETKGK